MNAQLISLTFIAGALWVLGVVDDGFMEKVDGAEIHLVGNTKQKHCNQLCDMPVESSSKLINIGLDGSRRRTAAVGCIAVVSGTSTESPEFSGVGLNNSNVFSNYY
jgi:hypothetical protein